MGKLTGVLDATLRGYSFKTVTNITGMAIGHDLGSGRPDSGYCFIAENNKINKYVDIVNDTSTIPVTQYDINCLAFCGDSYYVKRLDINTIPETYYRYYVIPITGGSVHLYNSSFNQIDSCSTSQNRIFASPIGGFWTFSNDSKIATFYDRNTLISKSVVFMGITNIKDLIYNDFLNIVVILSDVNVNIYKFDGTNVTFLSSCENVTDKLKAMHVNCLTYVDGTIFFIGTKYGCFYKYTYDGKLQSSYTLNTFIFESNASIQSCVVKKGFIGTSSGVLFIIYKNTSNVLKLVKCTYNGSMNNVNFISSDKTTLCSGNARLLTYTNSYYYSFEGTSYYHSFEGSLYYYFFGGSISEITKETCSNPPSIRKIPNTMNTSFGNFIRVHNNRIYFTLSGFLHYVDNIPNSVIVKTSITGVLSSFAVNDEGIFIVVADGLQNSIIDIYNLDFTFNRTIPNILPYYIITDLYNYNNLIYAFLVYYSFGLNCAILIYVYDGGTWTQVKLYGTLWNLTTILDADNNNFALIYSVPQYINTRTFKITPNSSSSKITQYTFSAVSPCNLSGVQINEISCGYIYNNRFYAFLNHWNGTDGPRCWKGRISSVLVSRSIVSGQPEDAQVHSDCITPMITNIGCGVRVDTSFFVLLIDANDRVCVKVYQVGTFTEIASYSAIADEVGVTRDEQIISTLLQGKGRGCSFGDDLLALYVPTYLLESTDTVYNKYDLVNSIFIYNINSPNRDRRLGTIKRGVNEGFLAVALSETQVFVSKYNITTGVDGTIEVYNISTLSSNSIPAYTLPIPQYFKDFLGYKVAHTLMFLNNFLYFSFQSMSIGYNYSDHGGYNPGSSQIYVCKLSPAVDGTISWLSITGSYQQSSNIDTLANSFDNGVCFNKDYLSCFDSNGIYKYYLDTSSSHSSQFLYYDVANNNFKIASSTSSTSSTSSNSYLYSITNSYTYVIPGYTDDPDEIPPIIDYSIVTVGDCTFHPTRINHSTIGYVPIANSGTASTTLDNLQLSTGVFSYIGIPSMILAPDSKVYLPFKYTPTVVGTDTKSGTIDNTD
jgi:hypothetical protein